MTEDLHKGAQMREAIHPSLNNGIAMDPLTLRFSDEKLEMDFQEDFFDRSLKRSRYSVILGIFVMAVLGILDGWIIPEAKMKAWFIRYAIVCPLLTACFFFTYTPYFRKFMQLFCCLGIFIAGAGVISIIAFSNPPGNYLYYAGLILVIMFAYTAVPLRFVYASLVSWLLVAAYWITALWINKVPMPLFLNNNFFFISANIIGMIAGYMMELQFRNNFLQMLNVGSVLGQLENEIEERKKTEETLRESEAKYRTLIEDAGDAIVLTDVTGNLLDLNKKVEEMFGYTKDELLKMHCTQLHPPHEIARVVTAVGEFIRAGEGTLRGITMLKKDGQRFSADIAGSVITCGNRTMTQAIIRDITERKEAEDALRQAKAGAEAEKAKFEAIIKAMGDGLIIIDRNFRIVYQNEIFHDVIGDHAGKYCYRAIEKQDDICEGCPVEACFLDGKNHLSVRTVITPRGVRYFENTAAPLKNAEGEVTAAIEVVRDITERRKMQEELQQYQLYLQKVVEERTEALTGVIESLRSEITQRQNLERKLMAAKEQLESFINNSADGINITDTEGNIIKVNRAFEEIYGWTSEELLGKKLPIVPDELFGELQEFRRELLEEGRVAAFETTRRRKDGSLVNVSVTISPVFEQGKIVAIAGITRDITERKQIEEALIASETQFKNLSYQFNTLLDAIPDVLVLLSPDMKVIWANTRSAAELNMEISDVVGQFCHRLWFNSEYPCEDCVVLKSFSTGRMESGRITSLDGRFWDTRAIPLKDENGEVHNIIVVANDVSEKIRLQAEALRTAHLVSLGELAAGVAHEINNPINGIINYAQLLFNDSKPDSGESDISGRIIKEGVRIADIVRNLLSFARQKREDKIPVHIHEIWRDTFCLMETKLRRDGIKLHIDIPDDMPGILAHPQQLQQVFLNVVQNAQYALNQKYPGGHQEKIIDIRGERIGENGSSSARITFFDRGTGIPAGVLDKVMNPFFTTKPPGIGTGLGLSISHGIIGDHGGSLKIDSVEGEFTKVVMELPGLEVR